MSEPQPLNYCRQMVKQFKDLLSSPNTKPEVTEMRMEAITMASRCQKFMLPYGGTLIDDLEMKALEGLDSLSLPHQYMAIEYCADLSNDNGAGESAPKRIIFAIDAGEHIVLKILACFAATGMWQVYPLIAVSKSLTNLDRMQGTTRFAFHQFVTEDYDGVDMNDYRDEITVFYGLLNALSCSNVRSEVRRAHTGKRKKGALPFDDYHVLVLKNHERLSLGVEHGPHRSPREHLRRGHIRRLADGRRLWINAMVVNAGVGGKVSKDYVVKGVA